MTTQPEALRLAEALQTGSHHRPVLDRSAAELRRLHAVNQELLEALKDALCALDCCGKDYPASSKARAAIAKAEGATK